MQQKHITTTVREYFEENYVGTGVLPQTFLDKMRGKVKGNPVQGVPFEVVGDITFAYNSRRPKPAKIKSLLTKEGGLNWNLYDSVKLATVPKDELGTKDSWDGLHRLMMACICLGPDAKVPVSVTPFDSRDDVHSAFWKYNGQRSTKVSPEQGIIAKVKAGDLDTKEQEIVQVLTNTTDVVFYVDQEVFEPMSNSPDWRINYAPVKDMVNDTRVNKVPNYSVIEAGINLYKETFEELNLNTPTPKPIESQVVKAFTLILNENQKWFSQSSKGGKNGRYQGVEKENLEWFKMWLLSKSDSTVDMSEWYYKEYPHDRMEKRHYGTAYGIWNSFVAWYDKKVANGNTRPVESTMKTKYYGSLPPKS